MEFAGGDEQAFTESPGGHDAEHLQALAAIGPAAAAGEAGAAVQIGLDAATIPRTDGFHPGSNGEHLHSQFVADDIWILPKCGLPQVSSPVRTANAHAMRGDEDFPRAGKSRVG
jgi:hypothetical protein